MKIDRDALHAKAKDYGRLGFGLAVKAGIIYVVMTVLGLAGGGIGGWWLAAHFDRHGWMATLAVLCGIAAGGAGGFFAAQIVIAGIVQDMLLDAGIKAGKTGYRKGKEMLAARQQQKTPPSDPA